MADISILVPWRTDHGQRQRIYARLIPLWHDSGLNICVGVDDEGDLFNINRALNRARAQATGDVLVVMGADHIPDPGHITRAVASMLRKGRGWAQLYDRRAVLSPQATRAILRGAGTHHDWPVVKTSTEAPGIVAVQARVWDDLGGRDERFSGWGGEDRAYLLALATLHGQPYRATGVVRDLWHKPIGQRTPGNHELLARYQVANGDPQAMRRVLAGAPTPSTTDPRLAQPSNPVRV